MAARADASTTLSGIAHLADDIRRALAHRQIQFLDALEHVASGDRGHFVGGALDEIKKLPLQRPSVARGPLTKPFDHVCGHVLDREAYRRHGSIIAPQWNHCKDGAERS